MSVIEEHFKKRADETQREFKRVFVFVLILLFMFFVVAPLVIFSGYDDWRANRDNEVKLMMGEQETNLKRAKALFPSASLLRMELSQRRSGVREL